MSEVPKFKKLGETMASIIFSQNV